MLKKLRAGSGQEWKWYTDAQISVNAVEGSVVEIPNPGYVDVKAEVMMSVDVVGVFSTVTFEVM